MKAIVQSGDGAASTFTYRTIDPPVVGPRDVLVEVKSAGVDTGTWHLRRHPRPRRVMRFGPGGRRPVVPGLDLAGVVVETGRGVTRFRPGDAVFGVGRGTFAELACAREDWLALSPAGVGLEAAAVPVAGLAALGAIRDHAHVRPGDQVMVAGASAGIGTWVLQLAKAYGAEVTGVGRTARMELGEVLRADHFIDYARDRLDDGNQRYDVVIDIDGNRTLSALRRLLKPDGRLVVVGGTGGQPWYGRLHRQVQARLLSPLVRPTLEACIARGRSSELEALKTHLENRAIVPAIGRAFALRDAARAIKYVVEGRARGEVLLVVGVQSSAAKRA